MDAGVGPPRPVDHHPLAPVEAGQRGLELSLDRSGRLLCSWKPAKSVPSYSHRARYRTAEPSRARSGRAGSRPARSATISAASPLRWPMLHEPGVPGRAVGVLGGDLVEQLVDDERLVRELRDDPSGGPTRSPRLASVIMRSTWPRISLALRLGGLDALVAQHRDDEVLVQREARPASCGRACGRRCDGTTWLRLPRRRRRTARPRPRRRTRRRARSRGG